MMISKEALILSNMDKTKMMSKIKHTLLLEQLHVAIKTAANINIKDLTLIIEMDVLVENDVASILGRHCHHIGYETCFYVTRKTSTERIFRYVEENDRTLENASQQFASILIGTRTGIILWTPKDSLRSFLNDWKFKLMQRMSQLWTIFPQKHLFMLTSSLSDRDIMKQFDTQSLNAVGILLHDSVTDAFFKKKKIEPEFPACFIFLSRKEEDKMYLIRYNEGMTQRRLQTIYHELDHAPQFPCIHCQSPAVDFSCLYCLKDWQCQECQLKRRAVYLNNGINQTCGVCRAPVLISDDALQKYISLEPINTDLIKKYGGKSQIIQFSPDGSLDT